MEALTRENYAYFIDFDSKNNEHFALQQRDDAPSYYWERALRRRRPGRSVGGSLLRPEHKPCLHQGQTVCDVNGFPIGEDMLGVEVDPVQDRVCAFPSFDI